MNFLQTYLNTDMVMGFILGFLFWGFLFLFAGFSLLIRWMVSPKQLQETNDFIRSLKHKD